MLPKKKKKEERAQTPSTPYYVPGGKGGLRHSGVSERLAWHMIHANDLVQMRRLRVRSYRNAGKHTFIPPRRVFPNGEALLGGMGRGAGDAWLACPAFGEGRVRRGGRATAEARCFARRGGMPRVVSVEALRRGPGVWSGLRRDRQRTAPEPYWFRVSSS